MMVDRHCAMTADAEASLRETAEAVEAAQAVAVAEAADAAAAAAAVTAPAAGGAAAPAPSLAAIRRAAEDKPVSAEQERAFGAAGGAYGRAAIGSPSKPGGNEKAAAIRKALTTAMRPK